MQPQRSGTPTHNYRPDIDGLRAIAVLAVVIYHTNPGALRGGFVGVDIFFVISGFLITGIIIDTLRLSKFSLLDFYARRIRRLFPALLVVLVATWIAGWNLLLIDEFSLLGKHIAAGAAFIPNIAYWLEFGYFDQEASRKVLLHLWSLGVEEQYYLFWPLLLLFFGRLRSTPAIVVALLLVSFAYNLYLTARAPEAAFYLAFPRFYELLVGSLLALCADKHAGYGTQNPSLRAVLTADASPRTNEVKAWLGIVLIVIAVAEISRWRAFPGAWALLPTIGAALLIASGPSAFVNRILLGNRLMVAIGLISYPLYLWHWPLLSFAENIRGYDLSKFERLLVVLPAFPLAWLTYRYIERPIRFAQKTGLKKKTLALLVAMIAVFAGGVWTYWSNGFPSRLPSEITEALQYRHVPERSYRYGTCFLDRMQENGTIFAPECIEASDTANQPLVLLWGDSHAAHLYPGFKDLQKSQNFRLGQMTACPPFEQPRTSAFCKTVNKAIESWINGNPPEVVVLAMRWSQQPDFEQALRTRVAFLRTNKVREIILMGPPPQWRPNLKGALAYNYFLNGKIESRTRYGLTRYDALTEQDRRLSKLAGELNLKYVSALGTLCNDQGCLTTINGIPSAIDSDHYSDAGSIYVMKNAAEIIAAALKDSRR